jgi:preprotein translocase subunit SecD
VAPSNLTSRPGRYLTALFALLVVMLLGVLGANLGSPSHWHRSFKVALGLDLSSGTTITLKAQTPHGGRPSQAAMTEAKNIITNRVEGDGLANSTVVQQGPDEIVVSVPGKGAYAVEQLVGSTALLRFRPVLLAAPNYTTSSTSTTSPSPSPSSTASSSPSPTPSSSKTSAGSGKAVSAKLMPASAQSTPKPSATPASSPSPSGSPSPSASPSSSPPTSGKKVLSTTAEGLGNASALAPATVKKFDKLNCADKNWQDKIYGTDPTKWDKANVQTVSCQEFGKGDWYKYALNTAVISGTDLTSASPGLVSGSWVIDFNVKAGPAKRLLALTTQQEKLFGSTQGTANWFLNQTAIVLDGDIVSTPNTQTAYGPSGEITGSFTQNSATQLANILKYGQLPLSFNNLDTSSVSPQLGSAQLSAGLIAGAIGLLLVVLYSLLYYRALAAVSVSSLAIAAALSYLAVVLLSKYEGFDLTLAGVAGLIVAIGITADSFVVFFERLRDEVRDGKSLRAGVEAGWVRARRTVLVSDTVSFLAALLLYIFAIGEVRGFAFTLGLTTLIDVVVVFLFTKPMVTLLARTKFYGQGNRWSGLDPARLGKRSPWRGSRPPRPATGGAAAVSRDPKEA